MNKYVCSVCGYIYDEEIGSHESDIGPGTLWEDVPADWECPLCGAPKDDFEKQGESTQVVDEKPIATIEASEDMKELSALEISAICSNLARGCEKQYKPEEAALFAKLAEYYKAASKHADDTNFDSLIALIEKDLKEGFPNTKVIASDSNDRGALRALTWSEKVTKILKSLLSRYQKDGDAMIENTGVFVCTICGFIYIGDAAPELCPVCKVQSWKFEEIEGGI